ncbi:MAG: hypothetical protein JW751_02760 [Polyangiaceae bacterium]|nr:hypothetical protein [Polyangiaceae bacterium]
MDATRFARENPARCLLEQAVRARTEVIVVATVPTEEMRVVVERLGSVKYLDKLELAGHLERTIDGSGRAKVAA